MNRALADAWATDLSLGLFSSPTVREGRNFGGPCSAKAGGLIFVNPEKSAPGLALRGKILVEMAMLSSQALAGSSKTGDRSPLFLTRRSEPRRLTRREACP